jgi:hypothetical protein
MIPCQKEEIISAIRDDLKEIKTDVKSLLQFKWQIMGGAAALGAVMGVLGQAFWSLTK